jgi:hypothetical protein
MANTSTPNGAVPVRSLTGPYMGNTNAYSTAAGDGTLLGIGDFRETCRHFPTHR